MAKVRRQRFGSVGESNLCTLVGLFKPFNRVQRFGLTSGLILVYDVEKDHSLVSGLCDAPIVQGVGSVLGVFKGTEDLGTALGVATTGAAWVLPSARPGAAIDLGTAQDPSVERIDVILHDGSRTSGMVTTLQADYQRYPASGLQPIQQGFRVALDGGSVLTDEDSGAVVVPQGGDGSVWYGLALCMDAGELFCSRATKIANLAASCG